MTPPNKIETIANLFFPIFPVASAAVKIVKGIDEFISDDGGGAVLAAITVLPTLAGRVGMWVKEAQDYVEQKRFRDAGEVYFRVGVECEKEERWGHAAEAFRRAIVNFNESGTLDKIHKAYHRWGMVLSKGGLNKMAIEVFQEADRIYDERKRNAGINRNRLAEGLLEYEQAMFDIELGRWEKAEGSLREAFDIFHRLGRVDDKYEAYKELITVKSILVQRHVGRDEATLAGEVLDEIISRTRQFANNELGDAGRERESVELGRLARIKKVGLLFVDERYADALKYLPNIEDAQVKDVRNVEIIARWRRIMEQVTKLPDGPKLSFYIMYGRGIAFEGFFGFGGDLSQDLYRRIVSYYDYALEEYHTNLSGRGDSGMRQAVADIHCRLGMLAATSGDKKSAIHHLTIGVENSGGTSSSTLQKESRGVLSQLLGSDDTSDGKRLTFRKDGPQFRTPFQPPIQPIETELQALARRASSGDETAVQELVRRLARETGALETDVMKDLTINGSGVQRRLIKEEMVDPLAVGEIADRVLKLPGMKDVDRKSPERFWRK